MLLVDGSLGLEKLQNKPLDLRLKSIAHPRLKWRGGGGWGVYALYETVLRLASPARRVLTIYKDVNAFLTAKGFKHHIPL
jgi:hypothetical protein